MSRLPDHDPKAQTLATRAYINALRDAREVAPVQVADALVDCAPVPDEERMKNALLLWDQLGQNLIAWTMADNTVRSLTRNQLAALCDGMILARGLRSLQLHAFATGLKAQLPALTQRQVDDAAWPG